MGQGGINQEDLKSFEDWLQDVIPRNKTENVLFENLDADLFKGMKVRFSNFDADGSYCLTLDEDYVIRLYCDGTWKIEEQ